MTTPRTETIESRFTREDTLTSIKNPDDNLEISKNNNSEFIIPDKKITPEDFMAHTVLGKGSFGEVYLVQKKGQNDF